MEFVFRYDISLVWGKINYKQISILELIKRRSKVQEKNISCERALNFDQWKTFPKNYEPTRVWYGLFTNLPRIIVACDFSPSSFKLKEVSYLSWQNAYPNFKTTCHKKLKCFSWIKLLEYLLLVKHLKHLNCQYISVYTFNFYHVPFVF